MPDQRCGNRKEELRLQKTKLLRWSIYSARNILHTVQRPRLQTDRIMGSPDEYVQMFSLCAIATPSHASSAAASSAATSRP